MLHSLRKSTWRNGALLVIAALLVMTMAACGAKETEVATYKGGNVTDKEFDKYVNVFVAMQPTYEQIIAFPQFKEQLLQQYIGYKILGSQASKEAKKKAQEEADAQMVQFKQVLNENPEYKTFVEGKKVKESDVEDFLLFNFIPVAHMDLQVTEEDMKSELETNGAEYATITVRHILVATTDQSTQEQKELRTLDEALARAKEVKSKLEAGGDWAALAKEYSDDPGSKDTGGLYADQKAGVWVDEFKQAAKTQEIGVIGDPVETQFGYHVILVEKRTIPAYDELTDTDKDAVKNAVTTSKMNSFMTEELPKQEIEIKLPEPSPSPTDKGAPANGETPATDAPAAE
ncbi:foldase protein PrsA [Paenibacillus sp. sgz302251]|uniref:peptidylprolyl isomerase n=1 Tax=Paenibacillus sp. sgz302251 TaxID=3414493 RepID=UPI003C7CDF80